MDEEKDSVDKDIKEENILNESEENKEYDTESKEDEIENKEEIDKEKLDKEEQSEYEIEKIDTEPEEIEYKSKNNKKYFIIGIIITALILLSIVIHMTVSKYENLVYPNVTIYEQDISKLDENQLKEKLEHIVKGIDEKYVYIDANNKEYKLNIKDISTEYNINELSNEIFNYGKDGNSIENFLKIIFGKNKDYKVNIETNKNKIEEFIKDIANTTSKKAKNPEIKINNEDITYIDGKSGIKLNEKKLLDDIEKGIKNENIFDNNLKIKVKYEKEAPTILMEDLKTINKKISTYSTNYGAGGGRGKNVELAAKQLDNIILMPGAEFSYEKTLGDITLENGYSYAPVIVNGELKDGVGGGVCQVSSTLYNTQLKAGILPTERRNHSKAVNYVPRGLDATLATGSIDYKFKNTYDYPIVINTKSGGGTLTIEFWSNENALKGIEYKAVGYASGNIANTYLYGYDKAGKKVYEKHIDTSVYR